MQCENIPLNGWSLSVVPQRYETFLKTELKIMTLLVSQSQTVTIFIIRNVWQCLLSRRGKREQQERLERKESKENG